VALGFVDPSEGVTSKGDNSLWAHLGILLRGDYICSTADILAPIMLQALLLAVPAAALGRVFQAVVIMLWSGIRQRRH